MNSSSSLNEDDEVLWAGFLACLIAVIGFGSNFVPVKQFKSGDGLFFQFVMCIGVWCVGMCVYAYQGFPKFEPYALLGGVLWCTGNVMSVPIIQAVGMALGMSLWNVANLAMGWSTGAFGIFGVKKQKANVPVLNYIGAVIAICSIVVYVLVQKVGNPPPEEAGGTNEYDNVNTNSNSNSSSSFNNSSNDIDDVSVSSVSIPLEDVKVEFADVSTEATTKTPSGDVSTNRPPEPDDMQVSPMLDFIQRLPPMPRLVVGIVMAVCSGFLYGSSFNPSQHLIDFNDKASKDAMDYVFPHFTGILLTSTFWMLVYSGASKNSPAVYRHIVVPGFLSGVIWAVAEVAWFVANENLSFTVSFPIITTGPSIVGSLWGVLVFKEIRGKKKILVLIGAICVTLVGVIFISLSKLL